MNLQLKTKLASLGPMGRCAALAVCLAVVMLIAFPIAYAVRGMLGVYAAVAAAAVIWLATSLATIVGEVLFAPNQAVARTLVPMAIRMLVPLVGCLIVFLSSQPLVDGGFPILLLAFYLLALPVDVLFAVSKPASTR